jgi:adenylate kinase
MTHIDLTKYALENGFILEQDTDRKTPIVDLEGIKDSLKEFITKKEQGIIIEGHYSHVIIDEDLVNLLIILRKAPWELFEILQNRLYDYEKIWENLESEIMGIITNEAQIYPKDRLLEIDTTGKTPEKTVEEIKEVIIDKKTKRYEPIDWVAYPDTLRLLVKRTCIIS